MSVHELDAGLHRWLLSQRRAIREALGGRGPDDSGDISLGSLTRPSAGYSNVTLLGSISWATPDGENSCEFVLRLQPEGDSIFPGHDILQQCRVMQALGAAGFPVPEVLGVETASSTLGRPFYLMRRLHGESPNENPLYHQSGWFHDLPATHQRDCWNAGIDMIARLARLDWRSAGLGFLAAKDGSTADGSSPLERQLDYYSEAVAWAERLAEREYPLLRAAEAWLRANRPVDEPVAFSWGDAKLGNCLFQNGALVAVLDFEQATLASPVDDLAWWLMLDESLSRGYGVPRLPALPSRAESIARWEAASGFRALHLEYYEVYAAWRMAFIMARIAHIFRLRGWIAPDSNMDERNGGANLLAAHGERLGFSVAYPSRAL